MGIAEGPSRLAGCRALLRPACLNLLWIELAALLVALLVVLLLALLLALPLALLLAEGLNMWLCCWLGGCTCGFSLCFGGEAGGAASVISAGS